MRCSAIVVTYNSGESIGPCLEALTREDCEIVVVDNASADDSVHRVEEFVAWHPLRLIANEQNLGFGAAVNQGAREATGDVLLILNPDAIAETGSGHSNLELPANYSGRRRRRCSAGKRRPARTRLRVSPSTYALGAGLRGNAGQSALAGKSCESLLSLSGRGLFAATGG